MHVHTFDYQDFDLACQYALKKAVTHSVMHYLESKWKNNAVKILSHMLKSKLGVIPS